MKDISALMKKSFKAAQLLWGEIYGGGSSFPSSPR